MVSRRRVVPTVKPLHLYQIPVTTMTDIAHMVRVEMRIAAFSPRFASQDAFNVRADGLGIDAGIPIGLAWVEKQRSAGGADNERECFLADIDMMDFKVSRVPESCTRRQPAFPVALL